MAKHHCPVLVQAYPPDPVFCVVRVGSFSLALPPPPRCKSLGLLIKYGHIPLPVKSTCYIYSSWKTPCPKPQTLKSPTPPKPLLGHQCSFRRAGRGVRGQRQVPPHRVSFVRKQLRTTPGEGNVLYLGETGRVCCCLKLLCSFHLLCFF